MFTKVSREVCALDTLKFCQLCSVTLAFVCSDNFLTLEIFFGALVSQDVTQSQAYDGFTFFCKSRCRSYSYIHRICTVIATVTT